jgi:hypothetical protein
MNCKLGALARPSDSELIAEYRAAYAEAVERVCHDAWLGLQRYGNPDMVFIQVTMRTPEVAE